MLVFQHLWMFVLLPLPLVVRWLTPAYRESRPAVRVPIFDVLIQSVDASTTKGAVVRSRSRVQVILFVAIWVSLVFAMARPQWLGPPITKEVATRDLLLAVDLSGSMETEDFTNADGDRVDRLTAAKEVLDDFLSKRRGDRVGMIVFGTGAFVQIPFTQDLDVCRELLDQTAVRMAGPKTAFGDAIGLSINLFARSDLDDKVLIAMTDGNDTGSKVPPAKAAAIAADNGIVIHTIGVGDPTTAGEEMLDEDALREVAKVTDGKYFFAADREALGEIYGEIDQLDTREVETISHRPKEDLHHYFVIGCLLLSMSHLALMLLVRRSDQALVSADDGEDSLEAAA